MSTPNSQPELGADPALNEMDLSSRREIEAYFELLNRESPIATRQIARWDGGGQDSLKVRAVLMPERFTGLSAFLGDSRTTFALDVEARNAVPASAPFSVGMVLSGAMRILDAGGEHLVQAGQGVIVNPCDIERTWMEAGTHLIEFMLPKASMLSLGAEWAPGSLTGPPQFDPVLPAALAQRMLVLGREAAGSIPADPGDSDGLFRRWVELISLTLLHEQPIRNAVKSRMRAAEPPPTAVRRALDFIEAHAGDDIMLADIAAAAHLSVASLGRAFNKHLGQSPAALLRDLRLDRVHEELRRGSVASIRALALRWGFQCPSQFRRAYQRRFGQMPSDTRTNP